MKSKDQIKKVRSHLKADMMGYEKEIKHLKKEKQEDKELRKELKRKKK